MLNFIIHENYSEGDIAQTCGTRSMTYIFITLRCSPSYPRCREKKSNYKGNIVRELILILKKYTHWGDKAIIFRLIPIIIKQKRCTQ
jgi:hypothetical protein